MVSTIGVPKLYLILALVGGLSTILIIGLSSGLAARPNNCKERTTESGMTTPTPGTTRPTSPTISTTTRPITTTTTTTTTTRSTTTTISSSTSRPASSSSTSPTTTSRPSSTASTASTPSTQSSTTTTTTAPASQSSSTVSSTTTTVTVTPTASGSSSSTTVSTTATTTASTQTRTTPTPVTSTTTTPGTTTPPPTLQDIQLPPNYDVENYDLLIKSYFVPVAAESANTQSEEYFRGTVKITFNHKVAANTIILHVHESMNITDVKLTTKVGGAAPAFVSQRRLLYQKYELTFAASIPVGDYILEMSYNGDYGFRRGSLAGFYLSKYKEGGQLKTVASTQFQPTDARRAFPCFDEPALKATFTVTIQHPVGTKAVSNWPASGPTTDVQDENNKPVKETKYDTTFRMATYLAAWAIVPDDYIFVEVTSDKGVPIRIHSRASATGLLDFAAEAAKGALDYFENVYFGISEAVPPKIDMISIPQFSAGAMENWGLVTYRETALLYSDATNSLLNKQSVASIISHELAHFWFGNYVTCKWWSDLWLNEAMASFLQVKAVEAVYPEFGIIDQFITSSQIPVMYDDGFYSTHPVFTEVISPDQINSIFDSITYDKGNALLRMLEATVTPANFQAGLQKYLTENALGSGEANDFYNDLVPPAEMATAGVTITEFMDNWLNSVTFPWINIFLQDVPDPKASQGQARSVTKVSMEQDRFYYNEYDPEVDNGPEPDRNFLWKIYLRCKAGGTRSSTQPNPDLDGDIDDFQVYFDTRTTEITLGRDYTWVKCNNDFKGYFMIEYEDDVYQRLSGALQVAPTAFSPADQAEILNSVWVLAYAEYATYGQVARLNNFLTTSNISYVPWRTFTYHVSKVATILEHRPSFYGLSRYAISIMDTGIQTWEDTDLWNDQGSHGLRLTKIAVADALGRMQDYETLLKASELFNTIPANYFQNPSTVANPIPPNLRSIVYKYHVQNTYDIFDWEKIVELYEFTSDPQERAGALLALTFPRSTSILDELLINTVNGFVSGQDLFTVLGNIGRNPSGRGNTWNFLRANWNYFYERFGSSRGSGNAVRAICESFDNALLEQTVREFYLDKPVGADRNVRVQTLYIVDWNRYWVRFKEEELVASLVGPL